MSQSVTFEYNDGSPYSQTFECLSVRGLDEPDQVELIGFQFEALDGSIIEFVEGFRRVITIGVGVIDEAADREFMLGFLHAQARSIYLGGSATATHCVLADPEGFENEWKYDTSVMRYYDIELLDTEIYTVWPAVAGVLIETGDDWLLEDGSRYLL